VIIPTFDRREAVCAAVRSVLEQTYAHLEAIVVDDGSTDGTAQAISDLAGADPRVTLVRRPRGGVAAARNTGLARARGELIAFLDSDDVWLSFKLELQLACLRRLPQVGMIWTEMRALDAGGRPRPGSSLRDILTFRHQPEEIFSHSISLDELPQLPPPAAGGTLRWGDIYRELVLGNLVLPSSALLTRERLALVGGFDDSLKVAGEDFDFFLRVAREGEVAFVDVATVLKQTGRADQLTDRSRQLQLARNYLTTLEAALARDPERLDAGRAEVRASRAHAHRWIAQSALESGQRALARSHLRRALRLEGARPRSLALLGLVALPAPLSRTALAAATSLLGRLRRLAARLLRARSQVRR